MVLARWDSHCVLRYAKEAPLKTLTEDYKKGVRVQRARAIEDKAATSTAKLSKKVMDQIAAIEVEVAAHDDELDKLKQRLKIVDEVLTPKYIISEKYQKWQICLQFRNLPVKEWKAVCGWKYGRSVFERRTVLAENMNDKDFCSTCFDKDAEDLD